MAALDSTVFLIIGILLVVIGLALAFIGRKLWTPFMSLVGAILGGSVGYFVGAVYTNSTLAALALAMIGSILGSILFNYLVKIALALIAAGIPAGLAYLAMAPNPITDQSAQDLAVIVAILVLLVVFAIAYYFVEELIGIVTALVGGALVGIGAYLAGASQGVVPAAMAMPAIAVAGIVFLLGAILQTLAIRRAKKGAAWRFRRRKAAAAPPARVAQAPPPPAPTRISTPSAPQDPERPPPPPPE